MSQTRQNNLAYIIAGILFITIGLGVFLIRLGHAGSYAMPQGAGAIGGLAAVLLGGYLLWPNKPRFTGPIAIVLGTVASLPAIYSIAGESQEVISLYAIDSDQQIVDLRLWVVDREDGAWVGMGRNKVTTYQLDGAELNMLRNGKIECVKPMLTDDMATTKIIHSMKVAKYTTAQLASAIGLYPKEATSNTAALRLDSCKP